MGRMMRFWKNSRSLCSPGKDGGGRFVRPKFEQLNEHVAGHGDVAERHDEDEPEALQREGALLEADPDEECGEAEVGVKQRGDGPRAGLPAELGRRQQDGFVRLDVEGHDDHPDENRAEENFQQQFHSSLRFGTLTLIGRKNIEMG